MLAFVACDGRYATVGGGPNNKAAAMYVLQGCALRVRCVSTIECCRLRAAARRTASAGAGATLLVRCDDRTIGWGALRPPLVHARNTDVFVKHSLASIGGGWDNTATALCVAPPLL